tara:strand:+ start:637 stop:867 length:231 start_codon:yes stop_codon:yes gene_type:complete
MIVFRAFTEGLKNSLFFHLIKQMTKYNSSPEDQHFKAIEDNYYRELTEWHHYEVALEQFAAGELEEKPTKPFLVMI